MNQFPGTNYHDLNLDWLLSEMKTCLSEWAEVQHDWETTEQAWNDLHAYVQNYFNNLDVTEEVNAKVEALITQMYNNGQLLALISPTITTTTETSVESWLEENITQETGYVIDATLTISGAAADAKVAGDRIATLDYQMDSFTQDISSANIFNGVWESGLIDGNGNEVANSNYTRTDFIAFDPSISGELWILRQYQPYAVNVRWYDSERNFLSGNALFTANATQLTNHISSPVNTAFVRISRNSTEIENIAISYSQLTEFVPHTATKIIKDASISYEMLNNNMKSVAKHFYGKKIVFMGDSIIGNFDDETGVCAQVAAKTGATVMNCAFGGTRMGYRHSNYGDATPGETGYNDGTTEAQKNQVDQYRYWNSLSGLGLAKAINTGNWDLQDSAVTTMSGALNYFQTRETAMKGIDWTTVDYILWEYGTNDFSTKVKLSNDQDPDDYFAFDNAYRQAIAYIQSRYPKIQVVAISPTWRWFRENGEFVGDSDDTSEPDYNSTPRYLFDFVNSIASIARSFHIPYIDDYYTLGANKYTYLQFFPVDDGVHPSDQGRERIAEHISSQLDSVV